MMRWLMPKLFVIHTPSEECHVTAMDFPDAIDAWGGDPKEIDSVEEYENPELGVDTIH